MAAAALDRPGVVYALGRDALDAISDARAGGRRVLSMRPATDGVDREGVFLSAKDVKALSTVEIRAWVGDLGAIRIGVAALHGRLSTLLRLGGGALASTTVLRPALVCEIESGDTVLLEGGLVETTGRLRVSAPSADESGVAWGDRVLPILDVNALYRWIEASVWERSALSRERG